MTDTNTNFASTMEKCAAERDAENAKTRAALLVQLRALGVTGVTAEYEGYGDSGNVEDITLQPSGIALPSELSSQLNAFAWGFAYQQHPGFENNEGGYGTLTWDLTHDSIDLDHADRFVESTHSYHEGL
ncbi:DUF6878 family protein [uncultured Sulfitobacter sp.]|uniref:DUF6878 family protein n=1 Tax=uncultured Sulfitobacter sp. TaxID=191468 RepID=UPI002599E958|nr:DUF6878 family protein [uncultured Sulfitobacter sp.]